MKWKREIEGKGNEESRQCHSGSELWTLEAASRLDDVGGELQERDQVGGDAAWQFLRLSTDRQLPAPRLQHALDAVNTRTRSTSADAVPREAADESGAVTGYLEHVLSGFVLPPPRAMQSSARLVLNGATPASTTTNTISPSSAVDANNQQCLRRYRCLPVPSPSARRSLRSLCRPYSRQHQLRRMRHRRCCFGCFIRQTMSRMARRRSPRRSRGYQNPAMRLCVPRRGMTECCRLRSGL